MPNSEKFKITKEECQNMEKAFKDEEFRKLFMEYAKEISDPTNRQLYEDELASLEASNFKGKDLIIPKADHVLKTKVKKDGTKVFINICSSSNIKMAEAKDATHEKISGQQWSVPHCVSNIRNDAAKDGKECYVVDVTFNDETMGASKKNSKFMDMIHSIALEAAEKRIGFQLNKSEFKTPKLICKGTPEKLINKKVSAGSLIDVSDNQNKAITPQYKILHRQHIAWQDFTVGRSGDNNNSYASRPKEIEVRIDLPNMNSVNDMDLEITDHQLTLTSKEPAYNLDITLPFKVIEDKGSARFDKATQMLAVTLPVVTKQLDKYLESNHQTEANSIKNETVNCEETSNIPLTNGCNKSNEGDKDVNTDDNCNKYTEKKKRKKRKKKKNKKENNNMPLADEFCQIFEKSLSCKSEGREKCNSESNASEQESSNEMPWEVADLPELVVCPPFSNQQDEHVLSFVIDVPSVQIETISVGFHTNEAFMSFPYCRSPDEHSVFRSRDSRNWCLLLEFDERIDPEQCSFDVTSDHVVIYLVKCAECIGLWDKCRAGCSKRNLTTVSLSNGRNENENDDHPPDLSTHSVDDQTNADLQNLPEYSTSDLQLSDLVDDVIFTDEDDHLRSILKRSASVDCNDLTPNRTRTSTYVSDSYLSDRSCMTSNDKYKPGSRRRVKSVSFDSLSTVHEFRNLSGKQWKKQFKTGSAENVNMIKALTKTKIIKGLKDPDNRVRPNRVNVVSEDLTSVAHQANTDTSSGDNTQNIDGNSNRPKKKARKHQKTGKRGPRRTSSSDDETSIGNHDNIIPRNPSPIVNSKKSHVTFSNGLMFEIDD